MRKIILLAAVALSLSGCAGTSILSGGGSLTATVTNPFTGNDLYAVENGYHIALVGIAKYRALGQCRASQVATLAAPCYRHAAMVAIVDAERKAHAAMVQLRTFVRNNPNISALSLIEAAKDAISNIAQVANANGVQ